jgi:hypothetical protein
LNKQKKENRENNSRVYIVHFIMVKHIYIKECCISGEDYSIIFRSNSLNEYSRLCEGLIKDMKLPQIKKITIITPRNINVLLFTDVINEFKKYFFFREWVQVNEFASDVIKEIFGNGFR